MKTKAAFLTLILLAVVVIATSSKIFNKTTSTTSVTNEINQPVTIKEVYRQSDEKFMVIGIEPAECQPDAIHLKVYYSIFGLYEEWVSLFLLDFMKSDETLVTTNDD